MTKLIFEKENYRLLYNVVGAFLDKSLPFVISIILTNFMTLADYGVWVQFYQVVVVVSASILSPIRLFFSREFDLKKKQKLDFYFSPIIFSFLLIPYFFIQNKIIAINSFQGVAVILLFVFYSLNSIFLRFSYKDFEYVKISVLRIFLFVVFTFSFVFFSKQITVHNLLISFLIAHLPFLFLATKNISFQFKFHHEKFGEFFRLFIYGLSTAMLGGIDRIIVIEAGYSYENLSFYAFALAFASLPSFLTEAVKQYMAPTLYQNLSKLGAYSKKTLKKLSLFIFVLCLLQLMIPFAAFKIMMGIGVLNITFINPETFYLALLIFNFGFIFHIVYQLIAPYVFFFDKSLYLLIIQLFAITIYSFLLFYVNDLNDVVLAAFRGVMFFVVFVFVAFPFIKNQIRVINA